MSSTRSCGKSHRLVKSRRAELMVISCINHDLIIAFVANFSPNKVIMLSTKIYLLTVNSVQFRLKIQRKRHVNC